MVGTVIAKVSGSAAGATYTMPATDGASGEFLKTDGSTNLSFSSAAAGFNQQVIYTTGSGTGGYSPDTGVTKIIVEILGAGGGGSRYNSDGPKVNAGGGGGYARKSYTVVSTDTMTVTIGTGGAAAASTNAAGTNGGFSKFETDSGTAVATITGNGGVGGTTTSYTGNGQGGTGVGGDLNIQGKYGKTQNMGSAQGGDSIYGWGGLAHSIETASMTPSDGTGYGAGGGGGADAGTAGAGTDGLCIITEYK